MTNIAFHLYQLQKIDTRIDVISARLKEIQIIKDKDQRVLKARTLLEDATNLNLLLEKELTKADEQVKIKQVKIEHSESALYGGSVKNPKELQDLQKEIISLKKSKLELEDIQYNILEEHEKAEQALVNAQNYLQNKEQEVNEQLSSLDSEIELLKQETDRLSSEKSASLDQIEPDYLRQYQDLRSKKKGIAIAILEDQCCSLCGSKLTPAECQAAKSPSSVVFCPSCGRIIYAG